MAQRIRVPGLVDLVLVADPSEIRALNEEPRLDRRFLPRGPLVNRLIAGRIRRWFQIKGQPLPSLAARGDPVRAERQRELAIALDPAGGRALWSEPQLDQLASFVRGVGTHDGAAITVQEIVGRLFDPLYAADPESWRAATLIDRFREGFSPVQIIWLITGRLRRARALLVERANQNRWAMHGTAIGVHGIVAALERMRQLRALSDATSLGDDAVLGRCLAPPKQVPRTVEASLASPFVAGEMPPGALVMLKLDAAEPSTPGAGTVFMHGHWNGCPAWAFVTALLQSVWHRSLREGDPV
ncbi:MAG TPA: hypothetical protein VGP28_03070 [Methylocella sp.]|jgi:hypothetical protein|nr:hypothetical protein [Methylocella sp.]